MGHKIDMLQARRDFLLETVGNLEESGPPYLHDEIIRIRDEIADVELEIRASSYLAGLKKRGTTQLDIAIIKAGLLATGTAQETS